MKYNRTEKNERRSGIFGNIGPRSSILTLPGDAALCSQELERCGVIDKSTPQQWVESQGRVWGKLPRVAEQLGYSNVQIEKNLLEDYVPTQKIDLLNADMECSFTEKLGVAFEERLSQAFLNDTTVVMWLTPWARNPSTTDFHSWFEDVARKPGVLRNLADITSDELGCSNPSLVIPIVLLKCALHKFTWSFDNSASYADTVPMHVFRLRHIFPLSSPVYPSFTSLQRAFNAEHSRQYEVDERHRDMLKRLRAHYLRIGMTVEFHDEKWWVMKGTNRLFSGEIPNIYESIREFM